VLSGFVGVKNWEIIADSLSKAGFSWGCSSEIDATGRELFTADAYSRDGRRFTVLADEKLSAFLELERVKGVALGKGCKAEMKRQWEIIADNLSKAGWSWGYVSAVSLYDRH
jgi:hypothetical protein